MQAGQRLVASDGYEVALFPMPYLYMTQDEGGNTSHQGTYNLDFIGWSTSGRIYQAPIYAPCSCRCVYALNTSASGNLRVYQSDNLVHTPGGLRRIMFYFGHDSNPPSVLNQHFNQGDLIYHTGEYGIAYGDHTHTCMGIAPWIDWSTSMTERPPYDHVDFTNRIHYWDAVYVNDTTIIQGYNHNWQTWSGPTPPPTPSRTSRFPWVLYARKLREERSQTNV